MTLLEYAHGWYDLYQNTKPYMEFRTFVESLKRPANKTLIESISNGVSIIIEANLGMKLGTIKNDTAEFKQLVEGGDKRAVLGYALPILYRLVQAQGGDDVNKTDKLLTHAVDYITDNWKKLLDYDGSTKPSTFLSNFVLWPAKQERKRQAGRDIEVINYPHAECYATFEENFDGMKTKVYGIVKDPDVPGGKVKISWKAGPDEGTVTTEHKDVLVFYDLVEDSNKTVSASTPLGSGPDDQQETLGDTAAFADNSQQKEDRAELSQKILNKAIKATAHYLANENSPDDDSKYDELNKLYTTYLSNLVDKEDSSDVDKNQTTEGESVIEQKQQRDKLLWEKTRKWQALAVSLNNLAKKLETNGTLQQIDPSISAESISNGLKSLTPVAKEGGKKRGSDIISKTANSTNLKEVLGDALYDLVYKQKATNIDNLDALDSELGNIANARTIGSRRSSASTNVDIPNSDKSQLEKLMKTITQKLAKQNKF